MHELNQYIGKQSFYCPHIEESPFANLNTIIVIPCYDEPDLFNTLASILHCDRPMNNVEVITVIDYPENATIHIKERHKELYISAINWAKENQTANLKFHFLYAPNLKKKFAGAGYARKIGMDEAVYRFCQIKNERGVICSLDADAIIEKNYLIELEKTFHENPRIMGCSIYFEHPVAGDEYPPEVYDSILYYELYLRYYIEGLRYAGFPYAYHTVGSCFAVTASSYARQGGMNKRQGGEDFYFLQKIIPLGSFIEISTTCVRLSPRPSRRVPFGTGPAVLKYMELKDRNREIETYHIQAFRDLKVLLSSIDSFYRLTKNSYSKLLSGFPASIARFLEDINFEETNHEINANTSELPTFRRRFFHNFNAFTILRFMNYSQEHFFSQQSLVEAVNQLLHERHGKKPESNPIKILKDIRDIQRKGSLPTLPA